MGGVLIVLIVAIMIIDRSQKNPAEIFPYPVPNTKLWPVQSIDTMKQSRDLVREFTADPLSDTHIEHAMREIASSGATYVTISTPYDAGFVPLLTRWVDAARRHNLSVWFRGNLAGWEVWFNYPKINRAEHIAKTKQFIEQNPYLFKDGDFFDPCPECENGHLGDPRFNGDAKGHQSFLKELHDTSARSFQVIDKEITIVFSMNGDVARLLMNPDATSDIGGMVTIDHYVKNCEALASDVTVFSKNADAPVALGEFGVPVPDIHGAMNSEEQALYLDECLDILSRNTDLVAINYWVYSGGSTALWNSAGEALPAAEILKKYYSPENVYGVVIDERGVPIQNALVTTSYRSVPTDTAGYFALPYVPHQNTWISIEANGYESRTIATPPLNKQMVITIESKTGFFKKLLSALQRLITVSP